MAGMEPAGATPTSIEDRCHEIELMADALFMQDVDWVTFFNRILGVDGIVREFFPTPEDWTAFEQTATYHRVQYLLTCLRARQGANPKRDEPISVLTIRVPKSLQEALAQEAWELRTSVNRLCVSKLLRIIDQELVPPMTRAPRRNSQRVPRSEGSVGESPADDRGRNGVKPK